MIKLINLLKIIECNTMIDLYISDDYLWSRENEKLYIKTNCGTLLGLTNDYINYDIIGLTSESNGNLHICICNNPFNSDENFSQKFQICREIFKSALYLNKNGHNEIVIHMSDAMLDKIKDFLS